MMAAEKSSHISFRALLRFIQMLPAGVFYLNAKMYCPVFSNVENKIGDFYARFLSVLRLLSLRTGQLALLFSRMETFVQRLY